MTGEGQLAARAAARLATLSHDLMAAVDRRGRIAWTNPAWQRMLGWEAGALAGTPYLELLHPRDRGHARAAEQALAEGAGHWPEIAVRVRTASGGYSWILFGAVFAPEDGLVYLSGKDVSARAEQVIVHARYRALVANLPDAVVTLFDPELRIVAVEGGQLARRGLDPSAYAGRHMSETMPAEHFARVRPHLEAALAGEPQAFDLETPDGRVVYRTQVVELGEVEGRRLGGMMISRDVTERRRHEQALASRAAELERSNQELAQFAYVASHDLSEPLRMITSYLQLLRRRYEGRLDEDADAFIGYAVDGAARMRALIEDLLAYSRAGRSERRPEPVDTAALVADVAATMRAQSPDRPPRIEWEELPVVEADGAGLTQVFQNLIGNGVKFVAPGVEPHVRVGARREGPHWRFTVDDNGIGIDSSHLERIFGMFQRLHSDDQFQGTGIGLAIAKKVVERHGGEIRALARPEGGMRFEFTLATAGPEAA